MREKLVGTEKERYISRLFGAIAPKYDLMNRVISLGLDRRWRRMAVAMSGLAPGGTALDVATGTGDFAFDLARVAGPNGRIVGVDFCQPMLELARRKLATRNSQLATLTLLAANAERLPFEANTFDCATIGFALRNVASVQATISEMARVVKPGGRVVSLEIVGPRVRSLMPFWRLYFSRIMPRIAQLFGAERESYDWLPESVRRFYSREELANIFMECDLTDVRVRNLTLGVVCIHVGTVMSDE